MSAGGSKSRRILFIGEAVTLAHVSRPFVPANALDPFEWEIHYASDPRYDSLLGPAGFRRWTIHSIPSATFLARGPWVQPSFPSFNEDELASCVEEDLELSDRVQPGFRPFRSAFDNPRWRRRKPSIRFARFF
jgi:UDP:flavonoid glycosyltransferase YjiC (YdhE family)